MTAYQTELTVDFGEVGYWDSKEAFSVRLDAQALSELIEHARNAHRVYELHLIDRPGDVWDYVWVVLESTPRRVADRVQHARGTAKPKYDDHPWPEGRIPFVVFDRLFVWAWDDTEPEDQAWRSHRDAPVMRAFAAQLLAMVRAAQSSLGWNDPLQRHEAERARTGTHAYAHLDRQAAIVLGRDHPPNPPKHTAAFYAQLDQMLRDPDLASIAYRADGDYCVLRMLAAAQRRRADETGHSVGHALHLSALVNQKTSNEAWDSEIWFFEEGLAHGDLFIEGGGLGGNLKALINEGRRTPGRGILSTQDEGELAGYDREAGEGWALYRKQQPDTRRRGLELIQMRRRVRQGPVLKFEGQGATLFAYDQAVVVVGEQVSLSVRSTLAAAMANWQHEGGDPLLVILGDTAPFEAAGCRDILQPDLGANGGDGEEAATWLRTLLWQRRRWIDVIIALEAPEWALRVLAQRCRRAEGPWLPWVVASGECQPLPVDRVLDGDLAAVLAEAYRLAQRERPQIG